MAKWKMDAHLRHHLNRRKDLNKSCVTLLSVSTKVISFHKSWHLELQILLTNGFCYRHLSSLVASLCWVLSTVIIIHMLSDTMEWLSWQYSTPFSWKDPYRFKTWTKKRRFTIRQKHFCHRVSCHIIKYQLLASIRRFLFHISNPMKRRLHWHLGRGGWCIFIGKHQYSALVRINAFPFQ